MAPGPDGEISLESHVAEMFGDIPAPETSDAEGEDTPVAAAGAPPAEHADPEDPTSPEGTDETEHAGAPPAVAADATPDEVVQDPDPLAGAVPLAYTVNGESRTYEGIKVLGEHGAIIDAKDLPDVMRRLGERDHLFEQSQSRYEQQQALERQTAWQTRDSQGNVQTLTGAPALQAQRETLARVTAANREWSKISAGEVDPRDAIGVDAEGNVFWRKDWIDGMKAKSDFEGDRSAFAVARHFEKLGAAPPPAPPSPADFAAPTIAQFETLHQVQGLTPEDKTFLTQQFPRYVTPDGKAVDPAFLDLMKRTAQANVSKATAVTAASDIAKANAAKLAAARIGKPAANAPRVPQKPKAPALPPRAQSEQDAWDQQENALHAGLLVKSHR